VQLPARLDELIGCAELGEQLEVEACTRAAFEVCVGAVAASRIRYEMPSCARRAAAVSPVGPAPTITTSVASRRVAGTVGMAVSVLGTWRGIGCGCGKLDMRPA
jgi:hypothetical protein